MCPLATNPNATFDFSLSTDMHVPEEQRPVFVFRVLSVTEWKLISQMNDRFDNCEESSAMIDLAFEVINKTLVNWRNMKKPSGKLIPFNLKKLRSMVSIGETTALMMAAVSQMPNIADKKKLDLQSASNTVGSAEKIAQVPKSVKTSPANHHQ